MQIDWLAFSPVPSLLGGMILGVAAALYVILHGRILGISGIVSGLLHPKLGDTVWRLSLVLGLVSAPFWAALIFDIRPIIEIDSDWYAILLAGLFMSAGFLTVFVLRHLIGG
jgi:uncharacterized membrane protein YedE/YeeE